MVVSAGADVAAALGAAGALALGSALLGGFGRRLAPLRLGEAFLVGTGGAAALLVLFGPVLGRRSLTGVMAALAAAAAAGAVSWIVGRKEPALPVKRAPLSAIEMLLLAGLVASAAAYVQLNATVPVASDGWHVWSAKAQLLDHLGSLRTQRFDGESRLGWYERYPPAIPLAEAVVARLRGAFDFGDVKGVFPFFFAALLLGVYRAVRAFGSRRLALVAALAASAMPALSADYSATGFADMPLAAVIATSAAVALEGGAGDAPSALPWLLGAMLFFKSEGMVVAGAAAAVAFAAAWGKGLSWRRARPWWPLAVMGAVRLAELAETPVRDPQFRAVSASALAQGIRRIPTIVAAGAKMSLRLNAFGLLWPAFVLSIFGLARPAVRAARAVWFAAALAITLEMSAFLFTRFPVPAHVTSAFGRLLAQLAPAAAITVAAAVAGAGGEAREPAAPESVRIGA